MRLPTLLVVSLSLSLLSFDVASAAPLSNANAKHAAIAELRFDVKRAKLDNGLRVVMLVDHALPTVAIDLVYGVGSRNEVRGRTGFAHLFEHMMFKGSANVAPGEHVKLVADHGGAVDATTRPDATSYFEMLPSSELALGLWLEADRMKSLDISARNFENQRAVVKEEYRMRIENAAYASAKSRLRELAYEGYWPYEHAPIGTMRDLDSAELGWVKDFHARYYGPNNAVLAVAGDFDEAECLALAQRYFGGAPSISLAAASPMAPSVPEQSAPRQDVVEDTHAKLPGLFLGWVIPPSQEPDHYALYLAAILLADGESSRLYRALVRERGLAIDVDASTANLRGPDLFEIDVTLANGAKVPDVEKLLESQLADVARLGPSDGEMNKLRARLQASFFLGLQSNLARAQTLGELEMNRGDASLVNGEVDRFFAVTKDDIKRVVGKYLKPVRRSLVEVRPGVGAAARVDGEKAK